MGRSSEYASLLVKENQTPNNSTCARLTTFLATVTVEPAVFLHSLGISIESIFYTNLVIDKVCLTYYKYDAAVCENLDSGKYTAQQDSVQRMAAIYNVYKYCVEYVPAIFVVLFLGMWSDTRGRRLPILLPFCGSLLKALCLTANSYWWSWPLPLLIVSYFPYGIMGGVAGVFAGAYSYVSDISVNKSRTTRLSIVGAMMMVALSLGKVAGTYIYNIGGYVGVFGSQAIIFTISILYTVFRLEEHPSESSPQAAESRKSAEKEGLVSFTNVKKTLMVVFRRREAGARGYIIAYIVIICANIFAFGGEMTFLYMYMRKRFDWNYYTYNMYSIIAMPVTFIGNFILLPVLSYYAGASDAVLGFAGGVSGLFHNVLLATAPAAWVVYLASGVSVCSTMTILSSRGALSKLVTREELGSTFAVLALGETLVPLLSAPLYTLIYNTTLDIFPGAVFIAGCCFDILYMCIFVWILTREVRQNDYMAIE
ncbi:lysosomal proton-coupled steroid conjugate and bile acid symporter SLC46A3 [Cherax quadricarinatus]